MPPDFAKQLVDEDPVVILTQDTCAFCTQGVVKGAGVGFGEIGEQTDVPPQVGVGGYFVSRVGVQPEGFGCCSIA